MIDDRPGLARVLLDHLDGRAGVAPADLEQQLEGALASAKSNWPGVEVDAVGFVVRLAERIPDGVDLSHALARMHLADLYLAHACREGDRRALALLEAEFLSRVPSFVRHLSVPSPLLDDVVQAVRERVLMGGETRAPRLDGYGGQGPLGAWLRIVSVRTAIDVLRVKDHPGIGEVLDADPRDPELRLIKARYADDVRGAFRETLAALPARDRTILRLHFVDGMSTTAIATLYHLDRSTVIRRVQRMKRDMLEATRRRLRDRTGLSPSEVDSVLGLVRSQVDVTITGILQGP